MLSVRATSAGSAGSWPGCPALRSAARRVAAQGSSRTSNGGDRSSSSRPPIARPFRCPGRTDRESCRRPAGRYGWSRARWRGSLPGSLPGRPARRRPGQLSPICPARDAPANNRTIKLNTTCNKYFFITFSLCRRGAANALPQTKSHPKHAGGVARREDDSVAKMTGAKMTGAKITSQIDNAKLS